MEVKISITVDGEISRGIKTSFETYEIYFGESKYTEKSDLREKELIKVLKKMHKISSITIDVLSCDDINKGVYSPINWKAQKAHRFICDYGVYKESEEDLITECFPNFVEVKDQKGFFNLLSKKVNELNTFALGLYLNEKIK